MTKILYLEDEHYLGRIVKDSLSSRGYDIRLVTDGANLMRNFNQFKPEICVLDIMVPNIDGYSLARMINEKAPEIPIIFLSAKTQTSDVINGFKSGGNDYIKKPFSMEELILRIENLLQLQGKKERILINKIIKLGAYEFAYSKFQLSYKKEVITLSHRENELILLFSTSINKKLDRSKILNDIWGNDSIHNSRNLDVYIRKLRVYFEKDPNIKLITLRGVGYHFSVL